MSMQGKITNKERNRQVIDFSGLRYRNITVTDIDAKIYFFEFGGEAFVFIEMKYLDKALTQGQELAFRRLVDLLPVPAIYIVGEHAVLDPEQEVLRGHECKVRKYYCSSKWHLWKDFGILTLKQVIDKFLIHHQLERYLTGPEQ